MENNDPTPYSDFDLLLSRPQRRFLFFFPLKTHTMTNVLENLNKPMCLALDERNIET